MTNPGQPLLCYVTDRRSLLLPEGETPLQALRAKISRCSAAGLGWIQIREKDLSGSDLSLLVRFALESAGTMANPPKVLVNDRLDIALALRADGVHLGETSLPMTAAKKLIGARTSPLGGKSPVCMAGVSCHSTEEARRAAQDGADYLFFGPVFHTPSKASFGSPQGLARLEEVCRAVSIPVLAIGGVTLENAAHCAGAGASGVAAIRLFQDAADPARTVDALRKALRSPM